MTAFIKKLPIKSVLVGALSGALVFLLLGRSGAQAVLTVEDLHKTLRSYITDEAHMQTIQVSGVAKSIVSKTIKKNGQDVPWLYMRIYAPNDKKFKWYVGVSVPASAFADRFGTINAPTDGAPVTVTGPIYWGHEFASIDAQ